MKLLRIVEDGYWLLEYDSSTRQMRMPDPAMPLSSPFFWRFSNMKNSRELLGFANFQTSFRSLVTVTQPCAGSVLGVAQPAPTRSGAQTAGPELW